MRRHTLFLLQGKDVQKGAVDRFTEWSEAGLLHRISVVDLETFPGEAESAGQDGTTADTEHFVLTDGVLSGPIRLLDWLADNYCDVLQIVALHTTTHSGEEREGVNAAERLRSELDHWLGDQQRVVAIACFMVDPFEATLHPSSVLETWSANFVISPTDQALPVGTATPVPARLNGGELNSSFTDIAAQNLCTIGGGWRFLDGGLLDHLRPTSHAGGVQVVRCFVRTLDLSDPTDGVIDAALQRSNDRRNMGWPVPTTSASIVPAMPPEAFATAAADQLCARYSRFVDLVEHSPKPPAPRTQLGLWTALKMYIRFLVRGALAAPRRMADTAVVAASTAASNALTRAIFGESSEFEITVGRPRLRPISDPEALQDAVARAARIADPNTDFMPPNTRELWQEYLRIGLALVDGGAMPPEQSRPQVGDARAVLTDPADVVVSPDHSDLVIASPKVEEPAPVRLSADDPLAVTLFRNRLVDKLRALGTTTNAEQTAGVSGAGSHASDPRTATDGPRGSTGEPSQGEGAGGGSATKGGDELAAVQEQLDEVDAWIIETRQPFTWKVGSRIGEALDRAEIEMLTAASQLDVPLPHQPSSEVRRRRVWMWIGIGVVGLVLCLVPSPIGWLEPREALVLGAVILVLGFLVGFATFLRDQRRQFQLRHEYDVGLDRRSEAATSFRHYARETLRLSSVYWQYREWTPILAGLLHDPFAGNPAPLPPTSPTVIKDSSRATRSGTAEPDPVRLESLTHDARRRIFTTGWAQRAWEAAHMELGRQFAERQALAEPPDPFEDNIRRRSRILEYLHSAVAAGEHGEPCREGPRSTARELVTSSPLGSLASTVMVDNKHQYPDAAAPADADPVEGLFHEVLPSEGERRFAVSLWRSKGLRASVDVYDRIIAIPPGWRDRVPKGATFHSTVPVHRNGQLLFAAARVDLSEPCHPEELTVFDADSAPVVTDAPFAFEPDDGGD